MKTIVININDSDIGKVRDLLQHLTYVKSFNIIENSGSDLLNDENSVETTVNVLKKKLVNPSRGVFLRINKGVILNYKYASKKKKGQDQNEVDEITMLSQPSLSEEWDSEEDARYDELYASKYLKNEVSKR